MASLEGANMPTIKDRMLSMGQMVEMQDSLNKIINKHWRTAGHKDSLTSFHFATQILVESVEMIDESGVEHTWWKHIEDTGFDEFNFKLEIIDMLHFYLSSFILVYRDRHDNKFNPNPEWNDWFMGSDVTTIFNTDINLDTFERLLHDTNKLDHEQYVRMVREMASLDRMGAPEVVDPIFEKMAYGLFHTFLTLARIECQEVSAIFQAKMELNRFRQSEGYKSGKYAKVKDGIQDNQRLEEIVKEFLDDRSLTLGWVRKKTRDTFFQLTV